MTTRKTLTIWIVDDNATYRTMLESFFSANNHQVLCFPSGRSALQHLLSAKMSEEPDTIVSDVEMPEMDGLEFLVEVRKHFARLPFFLLTADPKPSDARLATQIGASGYFGKTVALSVIMSQISSVVGV